MNDQTRPEWRKKLDKVNVVIGIITVVAGLLGLLIIPTLLKGRIQEAKNAALEGIREITYRKCAPNLYYEEGLGANRFKDLEDYEKHFVVLAEYLKANCPGQDFLITNCNYMPFNETADEIIFHCCQIVGTATVRGTNFYMVTVGDIITENGFAYKNVHDREPAREQDLISEKEIFETVKEVSKEYYKKESVSAAYQLVITEDDRLVYQVYVNTYSRITLDAYTGEVLDKYFWDGVIID